MTKKRINIATALFVFGILLAGLANAAAKLINLKYTESQGAFIAAPFLSTVLFCLNLFIYLFVLVFWAHSVRQRLLPSKSRVYLIAAACCAVAMLILRSVKYRMVDAADLDLARYLWYTYYVPMILLPTLFLMTCINIERSNRSKGLDEQLLLIPACILILLFLTNDLHHLAFRPNGDTVMTGANASYFNNIVFYLYYVYYGVTITAGLILLVRANRRLNSFRKTALPFAFLLIMLALVLIDKTLNWVRLPSMFTAPEIVSFGMIGMFESCVRNRLIPYNENYAGFFSSMRFPAVITQKDLTAVHRSAESIDADASQLWASLENPIYLDEDTRLTGMPVSAGYAFYTEDESELHRLNDKLREANDLLAGENDLIQAENELRAKQAQIDSRNLIYARIAEKMLPYHRRALEMIDDMDKDDPDFQTKLARLNLLNAYIKRGTNLLLVDEGMDEISTGEVGIALDELSQHLAYCGIQARVKVIDETILRSDALMLFTSVYEVAAALIGQATMVNIVINGGSLRMTADCEQPPELTIPAEITESDGLYYFIITCQEGGAA